MMGKRLGRIRLESAVVREERRLMISKFPKDLPQKCLCSKPNPLRNQLDTTPDPPVFPPQMNDFQKTIKFKSDLGSEFFGKKGEKPSEEKPSEQPQPKPKPKPIWFHCGYCGRDGHKDEFCFKRKREERLAKEWANKYREHPSNGVLEPRMQMPRAKAVVRIVPAWGDQRVTGGAAG
jgi:hypothetical protein